jgi:phosphoglycolate phosphatase
MSYRLVIFDFDGTLVDSYPWMLNVMDDLARRYRLPRLEKEELARLRTMEVRQILEEYKIPLWKMFVIGTHLKKLMSSQIDQICLVSGMREVIEALVQQGVQLAVVTSNASENVRLALGPETIPHFFSVMGGVAMFGKKKKFQSLLRQTGIPAAQALSIGDEVRDLKSARAAKIPFGAVTWGYTDLSMLQAHAPEEVFDSPEQILEAVSRG